MTFHLYKNHKQEGVSLMMAVLVLAAITAIVFSLATIVFIELRASRDLVRSEPNLYATLGVTEEALFQYKRYVNERSDGDNVTLMDVPSCFPSRNGICLIGNVRLELPTEKDGDPQPLDFDETPKLTTIFAGETQVFPLYSLNDYSLQYGLIRLQRVAVGNTGQLRISLRGIPKDPEAGETTTDYGNLSEGPPMSISTFFPDYQYELIVQNTDPVNNVQLNITSYAADGATAKGLPFIGKKVLKVVANYLGLTRTYTVYIPVP
ncbi:hypothetical protein IPM19_04120 [bacterium]|nr:MAG: hypothetical protein IPM19_04120 [bacterium]